MKRIQKVTIEYEGYKRLYRCPTCNKIVESYYHDGIGDVCRGCGESKASWQKVVGRCVVVTTKDWLKMGPLSFPIKKTVQSHFVEKGKELEAKEW